MIQILFTRFTTDDFSGLGDVFSDIIDDWCEELGGGSSNEKCCECFYIYLYSIYHLCGIKCCLCREFTMNKFFVL